MALPFRRIAILDPTLPWPHIQGPLASPLNIMNQWAEWQEFAIRQGADAFYLRLAKTHPSFREALIHTLLFPNIFHLVPPNLGMKLPMISALGFHFSSHQKETPPQGSLSGKSCHNSKELLLAQDQGFSYAFLSPVFPTQTHPEGNPLGLSEFHLLAKSSPHFPIFALGGVGPTQEQACLDAGAWGIAGIRRFLPKHLHVSQC